MMSSLVMERDTGFCSGGDEDEGFYSHTDASDDSADVKIRGASSLRNKRKCSEPRRLDTELPAKKRKVHSSDTKTSPFRPWSGSPPSTLSRSSTTPLSISPTPTPINKIPVKLLPWLGTQRSHTCEQPSYPLPSGAVPHLIVPTSSRQVIQQDEPLSLVSKKKMEASRHVERLRMRNCAPDVQDRVSSAVGLGPSESNFKIDTLLCEAEETLRVSESSKNRASQHGQQQRNYKNMTRERRIEANARERTRVHTISAAFDTLRHSIPAYSHNQKLSKLSVLRIACSYIVTLSRLAGQDYSVDQSQPALSDCVSNVTRTIQTEGKIRKKKDD